MAAGGSEGKMEKRLDWKMTEQIAWLEKKQQDRHDKTRTEQLPVLLFIQPWYLLGHSSAATLLMLVTVACMSD